MGIKEKKKVTSSQKAKSKITSQTQATLRLNTVEQAQETQEAMTMMLTPGSKMVVTDEPLLSESERIPEELYIIIMLTYFTQSEIDPLIRQLS